MLGVLAYCPRTANTLASSVAGLRKLGSTHWRGAYTMQQTKNLRAMQLLLEHPKLESTARYLGIEVDDALEMAEQRPRNGSLTVRECVKTQNEFRVGSLVGRRLWLIKSYEHTYVPENALCQRCLKCFYTRSAHRDHARFTATDYFRVIQIRFLRSTASLRTRFSSCRYSITSNW